MEVFNINEEKIVCSYIRLSEEDYKTDKTTLSQSIQNQIIFINQYAKSIGLVVNKNYIDDGYSGINFERPAFLEMQQDIESNRISTIITKDFSRLGREYLETAYYITRYFPENDIRYIAINENYDSDNPNSIYNDIMIGIKSIMNDRYVKEASVKIQESKRIQTEQGNFMGFIAPYGYKKVYLDNRITLDIDKYASNIVMRIYLEIANDIPAKEVAKRLNRDNILPPIIYMNMTKSKGKNYDDKWTDKIIYRIIRSRVYTGDNIVRKSVKHNYKALKRTVIPIKDREVIENTHPPIISMELYNLANEKIKQKKKKEYRIKDYKGILKGLVICGTCGRTMSITSRCRESGNIYYHFYCGNRGNSHNKCSNSKKISDLVLQEVVCNTIKTTIKKFVNKKNLLDKISDTIKKKNNIIKKIKNIEKSIECQNNKIKDLYISKAKQEISLEQFMKKKEIESNEKIYLEKELEELINKKDFLINKEELEKKYSEFIEDKDMYKFTVKDLIKKIKFNEDRSVDIEFNFNIMPNHSIKL